MNDTGIWNKKAIIITSSAFAIALACGAVALSTYALLTDSVKISNHLVGGKMDIKLERTYLKYNVLNSQGILEEKTDSTVVDFSAPTSENVFGFASTDKFVPLNYREATVKVSNVSNVAYTFYMDIKLSSSSNKFAEQLLLQVDTDSSTAGYEYEGYLSAGLTVGSESNPIAHVKVGDSKEMKVKISFVDNANNNDAQEQDVSFDLALYATQKTSI